MAALIAHQLTFADNMRPVAAALDAEAEWITEHPDLRKLSYGRQVRRVFPQLV